MTFHLCMQREHNYRIHIKGTHPFLLSFLSTMKGTKLWNLNLLFSLSLSFLKIAIIFGLSGGSLLIADSIYTLVTTFIPKTL